MISRHFFKIIIIIKFTWIFLFTFHPLYLTAQWPDVSMFCIQLKCSSSFSSLHAGNIHEIKAPIPNINPLEAIHLKSSLRFNLLIWPVIWAFWKRQHNCCTFDLMNKMTGEMNFFFLLSKKNHIVEQNYNRKFLFKKDFSKNISFNFTKKKIDAMASNRGQFQNRHTR